MSNRQNENLDGATFSANFPLRHPSLSWHQIYQGDYTPEWDDRLGVDVVNVGEGRGERDWSGPNWKFSVTGIGRWRGRMTTRQQKIESK